MSTSSREEVGQAIDRFNETVFEGDVILSADVTYYAGGDFLITILREDGREYPEAIHAIYDSLAHFEDFKGKLTRVDEDDLLAELSNLADAYNEAVTAGRGHYLTGLTILRRASQDGVEWRPRFHSDGGALPRVVNILPEGTPVKATLGRNVLYGTTVRDTGHGCITLRAAGSPKGYEFQTEYNLWFGSGWQFRIVTTTDLVAE